MLRGVLPDKGDGIKLNASSFQHVLCKNKGLVKTMSLRKRLIFICLHFGNVHELCHEEGVDGPHVKEE